MNFISSNLVNQQNLGNLYALKLRENLYLNQDKILEKNLRQIGLEKRMLTKSIVHLANSAKNEDDSNK